MFNKRVQQIFARVGALVMCFPHGLRGGAFTSWTSGLTSRLKVKFFTSFAIFIAFTLLLELWNGIWTGMFVSDFLNNIHLGANDVFFHHYMFTYVHLSAFHIFTYAIRDYFNLWKAFSFLSIMLTVLILKYRPVESFPIS